MSTSRITVTILPAHREEDAASTDTVTFRSKNFTYVFDWIVMEDLYDLPNGGAKQVLQAVEQIKADKQFLQDLWETIWAAFCSNIPGQIDDDYGAQWELEMAQLADKVGNEYIIQLDDLHGAVSSTVVKWWRRLVTWRPDLMTYEFVGDYAPDNPRLRG